MRALASPIPFRTLAIGTAVLALCYYAGARAGLELAIRHTNASPFWPPAGIAVAGLLLLGWRAWPGVWLGAMVANMVVFFQNDVAASPTIWIVSASIAAGNTLGALVGWGLCLKWIGHNDEGALKLDRSHLFERMSVFQFAAAALAAGLASSLLGPAAVCASQIASWSLYPLIALTWWCGDATGILYVAPFVLCMAPAGWLAVADSDGRGEGQGRSEPWGFWCEMLLAFASLLMTCWLVMSYSFDPQSPGLKGMALSFVIIAPLTWIAVRVGTRGIATGLLVLAAFVVWHAKQLFGDLDARNEVTAILVWLGFLWVVGMKSLTLASIVTSHKKSIASLRDAKAELEATMDAIPALVCVAHDPACNNISGNARAHEMLGVPPGGNLSKSPAAGNPPAAYEVRINGECPPPEQLAMQKAAATGKAVLGQEQELILPNGQVRIIYGNAMPLLDDRGASQGCVAAFVDVTERRRMEKALQESKQQLAADLGAMTRMQQVSARLAQADDFTTLLEDVLDAAIEISQADMGNIQLLENGVLRIAVQRGFEAPFLEYFDAVHSGQAACGTAMHHGARLIVDDVATSPVFADTPALEVMLAANARAVQSTPLVSHSGNVLGMFSTHYHTPQRPREQALHLLDILARQAADLIERTQAERALRESEERFRTMADMAPVMIWMSDLDKLSHYFNRPWLEFTGRTVEEESGNGWMEGVHPDDLNRCLDVYNTSFNARLEYRMEYRLRRHDGEYRWVLDHGVPRFGAAGDFAGYIGSCMDITDRKRVESDTAFLLGLSEQRRKAVNPDEVILGSVNALGTHLGAGRCLFATVDADGENFSVQREYTSHGPPLEGSYSMSTFGPDVVAMLRSGRFVTITDVAQDARTVGRVESFQRLGACACAIAPLIRDGRTIAMLVVTMPGMREWDLRETSMLITVTERMWLAMERLRLATELGASEARFRTMAEWVPVFIFTTAADGTVDYVNERFSDFTGMQPQAAAGEGWMRAIHPDDRDQARDRWRESIAMGQPYSCEMRIRSGDGTYRWFRSNAHPVYAGRNRIVKWFGSCADIDDLMRSNERLEERVVERTTLLLEANAKLEREFRERQRLEREMLDISEKERRVLGQDLHDGLCQHLSGVAFMASTLAQTFRDRAMPQEAGKLDEFTAHIRSASSQARSVAKGLHPVDVDADGLGAALKELAARHSANSQVKCRFRCDRPVPIQDNDVALQLYRIAQEALVNALKHAKATEIVIELSTKENEVTLHVTDNGCGISAAKKKHPSGMGLHLMRYRASVIGGNLTTRRCPKGGTTVTCVVPITRDDDECQSPQEEEAIA